MTARVTSFTTYPLFAAQTEIWLAQQLHPDSPVYNIAQYTTIEGAVDSAVFEAAWQQVISEADSLRLQFIESDEGLRQYIGSPNGLLPILDFSAEADPLAAAQVWMRADYAQPVDILREPLFRGALLKVAPEQFVWYQRSHHIIMDGYGGVLIAQRIAHVYSAMCKGIAPDPCLFGSVLQLLKNDTQYRTSARWSRDEAYWLKRCTGWPEPATLARWSAPALQHRLRQTTYLSAQSTRSYAEDANRLAQFMTAAMAAYIYRLTGVQDVVLGLPVTARLGADRHIPGMVSNTLPLRLTVQPNMDLSSLMQQTAQEIQRGFRYQRYPSETLRRKLGLAPGQLLFSTTVNVMPFDYDLSFGECASTSHNLLNGPVEDLMVGVYALSDKSQLRIDFNANPACYTVDELVAHQRRFVRFMEALAADATQLIGSIDLLEAEERHRLLVEWNATQREYPAHLCVHQLFEAQVAHTPQATALVWEDQTLSYAELNARANRLAHRLIELGIVPETRVAICVERSPAMVVGLLAILKAGGAYVPLDPAYPGERLLQVLADAAPDIVLADAAGRVALGEAALTTRTVLDPNTLPALADTNPLVPGLTARHLAYVIYTSGSTGKPKGVMVVHSGLTNYVTWAMQAYAPREGAVVSSSLSFDATVTSLWTPLLYGSTVQLLQSGKELEALEAYVRQAQAEGLVKITPAHLDMLGQRLQSEGAKTRVAAFVIGGEVLNASTIAMWQRIQPGVRLINEYGPTETVVGCVVYEAGTPLTQAGSVPIGRPIANTRIYLLDAHGQPVPLGAVGELYIGGVGVARGYLNRPELTAERFVCDPFSDEPGARLYKTGDLARYRPDGNLEFLGRNDHQIKLRGFRIEPGEIEARLAEHPQVRDAVVLARGENNDKRLIAYIVAEADDTLASTLRAHVAAALPEYMVPAAFVRLDAWPLTPNGKLDRRALPEPDDDALAHHAYEAPQGELETMLAAIWGELLGVERISRHDNFFALGGHSLLAVQLIERLRRRGLGVSVRALFDTPILSALAQALGQPHDVTVPPNVITPDTMTLTPSMLPLIDLTQADIDRIVEQVPGGISNIQDIYALSPLQDGILFHHLLATNGDPYLLVSQMAFANRALLDRYLDAVQQVVNRHDILRTAFVWQGLSRPAQVVWRHALLSIAELTLDPAGGPIGEQLAQRFDPRHTRLDLTQAPLLRLAIAPDTEGRWLLVQLLHHLIGDHSTLEIMHAEAQAFIAGRGQTLPAAQPFRHLVAQARLGVSEAEHERFFTAMLGDVVEPTLPFGLAEVHRDGSQIEQVRQMLPQALNDRLRVHAKRLGVSLASLCHLAWAQVLARASGQPRVVFGTVLFGRMQAGDGADSAMGLFINTLPLRVDLDGSVESSVRNTHARLAALLEHEHASLALAQRCSGVAPGAPLFSALLNYRHNAMLVDHKRDDGIEFLGAQERTNYPFTLSVEDFGSALGLTAQTMRIEPARVCRYMAQALHSLADALEATPKRPVRQLEVLPSDERRLLLQTWNATQREYPAHLCIHQLFEAQVAHTPQATALVWEDQTLSYAELNARANRLAHRLIELGIVPDTRVAICVERSPAMVVGLLAILKAGGAYVPLDPAYPGERLLQVLADAAPDIVLADAAGRVALGEAALTTRTVLDPNTLPALADTNPSVPDLTARHLAYVIYTSGSTGKPKGVMVEHTQAVNLLFWALQTFTLSETQHTLLATSISFDLSVYECFVPLVQGSTVHLADDALALIHHAQPVSLINTVPSALQSLLAYRADLSSAVTMNVAGEPLKASLIQQIFEKTPVQRLCNLYGPSESTTYSTWLSIQRGEPFIESIGRPIANTRIYLLDAHGQPVPLGAVGELYIGGVGVARGYLNRPELTAERFVCDPFSDEPGARLYKTGDLARYRPDGNLEFLGRNDHQIKLRGFRIEPGEIEARLAEHPQVRDAVVLARGKNNDKRLIAYIVAEADDTLASTLRAHVAAALPEYMVPAAFVRLDAWPLTPNGKLDRRALPEPDDDALAHHAYEAPQGELETMLAAIWGELLGVERISRHDNFFALGGHSLLAVQLIERLRRRGLGVSVRALFDTPILSALAQALGQPHDVTVPPNVITPDTVTLTPSMLPLIDLTQADIDRIVEQVPGGISNIQDIYALSPLQDGILFHHLLATNGDPYLLVSQMAFADRALLDRYLDAVQQVVNRHDILRTAFVWQGLSRPTQVVWRHALLSIAELTLDPAGGPIGEQLAQRFDPRHTRLDLTQAPLLRLAIAPDTEGRWLLVQLLHHLIGDHSTLEIMHAEAQAFIAGRGQTLPAAQPFRHLVAQARLGVSEAEHERFFTAMLGDVVEPTLPFGLAEVHRDGSQIEQVRQMLPQALNDRLRVHAKRLGVSLASLCHLAWAQVLARASGQPRVVFGTVLFGRMQAGDGADSAMGLFINTLPLRVDLDGSVESSVRNTHARLAALLEHEHASLALAQRCSSVAPGAPLFSALLNYRHNAMLVDHKRDDGIEFLGAQERTNYPFTLSVEDFGSALGLTAQTMRIEPARVCRYMAQALHSLADALEATPKRPVRQLEVLPSDERRLLLQTWNATQREYPAHLCIHQLFEAQVAHTPQATALVWEDQTLSYAELNARANRLAHRLIELGIVPDTRVAICVERSPAMVVGLLAILKAGGAYVPLDPAYPGERLLQVLADAAPDIVLADAAGRVALGEAALTTRTVLDPNTLPALADTNPSVPDLTARHLAYVIYTSGSTGTLKGVMIEHHSLANRLEWMQQAYALTSADRVIQKTSFGFDVSVWEFFWTLLNGATLVLAVPEAHKDPAALLEIMARQRITTAHFVPSMLNALLGNDDIAGCTPLRRIICSGEVLSSSSIQLCHEKLPAAQIHNLYGPTEVAIDVTAWSCTSAFDGSVVPIGRPIANTRIYLLDAHGQPVPLGAVGELYIGGVGVARGYLNRPDLTAERFLPDPFSDAPDARMYKTGDWARYLPDGNFEFLGCSDHQVKVGSLRTESLEIKARLVEHDQTNEAMVLALGAFTRQPYEPPVGEIETALAGIWQELLGIERVSRHDNFFELGGHSLFAVRMVNRLQQIQGITLPLATLFGHPTVTGLAQVIADIKVSTLPPVTPVSRDEALPLSFAQQRLWFLAQFDGVSQTYHIPMALRLSGSLDTAAWQAALDALYARHEALRSVFVSVEGEPQVALLPATGLGLIEYDLRNEPTPEAAWQTIRDDEARAPFDLARGPLIRARLIRLADEEHVFLLTQHHIISDGWSIGILVRELSALYTAFREDRPDPLPPLAIQYPDYAAWQRQWLSGERLASQAKYWRQTLADAPVLLALPTDRPRPTQPSYAAASVPLQLHADLSRELKQLARQHGITLHILLLAAWSAVLSRLSGQDDLVIGTPTANRGRAEIEPLVGFFVNTLALRIDLSGEPDTSALLERVKQVTLAAQDHQDLPFEQVVEIVQPPRRPDHAPVFQVMFAWQNNERGHFKLPELQVTSAGTSLDTLKFDLELSLSEGSDGVNGVLQYATDLFDAATIERQAGYLLTLLRAMVAAPDQPVKRIDLLSSEERTLLLETWNATQREYPAHLCIHQLFEAQVAHTPQATALVWEDQTLSYAELNARANRLAHRLIELGIVPDTRVAICVERSPAMVVGLLAILKAGGAYVPLDPAYPGERLLQVLADAAPDIVLADAAGRVALGEAALTTRTVLDPNTLPALADTNPSVPDLTARHLAYVIYTSGSTGKPKGVMVEHHSLANRLEWMQQAYVLTSADRVIQKTSFGFDVSVWEFFWTLLNGATLVVAAPDIHKDPVALMALIIRQRITTVHFVPSMLGTFLHNKGVQHCTSVKRLICSGEALSGASVRLCQTLLPDARLYNLYGPTEATIDVTAWRYPPDYAEDTVPIGRPIANTRIYLLDAHGQPVPLGAVGELYIGGVGVARGYLNRPELTAERFVCDPFSDEPGTRLYKTGDLARYRPDGNLEFLGRNDHQIKLRGFRIEPGEIEARLAEHPQVRDAVVLARGENNDKRLIAYIVAEPDDTLASTLHAHVAAALPEYMVPAAFMRLDAWPLTPNGKLDRRALPEPDDDAFAHHAYEAPQGELETMLAAIWGELLGVERISRHDNFFELGGHSLFAVRMVNRLQQIQGITLPLATLFGHPTVTGLAQVIADIKVSTLPPVTPVSRDEALPLSFAQQRLWFLAQFDGVSQTYHIPMALRLSGSLDTAAWQAALDALYARHEALRSVFVSVEGEPQVALLPATGLGLIEYDLRNEPTPEAAWQTIRDDEARAPFDLARGPLIRARLIRLADEEHVFLLTQHHIISDGWSIGILVRELSALYTAFREDRPDPLPPLAIQYPDYAAWQRQWLSGERLASQAKYWRQTLADAPVLLALPTDRPRPTQPSYAAASVPLQLHADLSRELKQLARQHGITLHILLLAAWSAVLSRLSGQDDLVIGTPTANRGRAEIEPLVGFFVNTLALRIDLSGEPDTSALLERVKQVTLAAQDHQDLPFEQVVEIVQPPRRPDHAPVFQVMFAWQNNERGHFKLPELQVTSAGTSLDTLKFDLELSLSEGSDGVNGVLQYATDLFDAATIERQAGYLLTLLRAMVAAPDQPVKRIDLLSSEERTLLLETWNATQREYPAHLCIHQLFEAQVAHTPQATALVWEDQTLSYAELNARANRLAHRLIELGIVPDTRVAICVERSPAMVVGLLAILKAGGAYVPLDPAYPGERLLQVLADAAPDIVLADAAGRVALGEAALTTRTVLDPNTLPALADTNPSVPDLTARHLAYVIYTSGSTGKPKGVMVVHSGLTNYVTWAMQAYAPREGAVVSSSLSFDATVTSLWTPLLYGSTVQLLQSGKELEALEAYVRQAQAEGLVKITPAHLDMLGQRLQSEGAKTRVAAFVIGGEVLNASTIAMWQRIQPGVRLINEYGPTETVVGCVVYEAGTPLTQAGSVPIGRPIANTRIYLLDAHGQPVPLGAVGELYIGGVGVARGYLNRPELTAERFVCDPFSDEPGARLYKTGDLARYRPDGNLEFLGRNDHQIKLRGFRIEPGEIEARLAEHPQVRDAVVLARGENNDKRLIAYIVAEADDTLASTLRAHVAAALPEYMVPAAFVRLDAWPLTPNGKLDRRALPEPDDDALAHHAYEAPQGELETMLAAIWGELLGVERISRHDNFFALGGHSLLAVQLIERLRRRGLGVSVRALFDTPILSALAQALGQPHDVTVPPNVITPDTMTLTPSMLPLIDLTQADIDRIVEQVPGGISNIQDIYALSPLQDGILFHHLLATNGDPYLLVSQMAFANRALLDRYLDAVQQVVNRHDILRTAFVWQGLSRPAQVVWRHALLSIAELTLDPAGGPIGEQLASRFNPRQHRIDLAQAPLIRFAIAQDNDGRWLLLQLKHHLIGDHATLEVMHGEVQAMLAGRGDTLDTPQPFRKLVAQARLGVSEAEHERFFTAMLGDVVEPTLPFGLAEVHRDGSQIEQVRQMLPQALNDRLRVHAKRLGVSLASLCHLAWAQVLARASGQPRVVFGTVLFGRMQAGDGADSAMGLFINTLPLRVDLDGSVESSVRNTHARLAALLEHEHASLALAQRCSSVAPGAPLFSALLNYRHNAMLVDHKRDDGIEFLGAQERTNYPFTLSVEDFGSALGLTAQTMRIEPARVCRYMAQALHSLADALEATPKRPVRQLEVLPSDERRLLLQTWNATQREYPAHLCIHQLFEAQVAHTPQATALVWEDQTLSYAELNARANRLAHRLIELGIVPDTRVAICVERSPAMVVGLLAILKAGGAYVPLDPAYPGERLLQVLADAAPDIVLADAAGRVALGEAALTTRTVLDPNTLPALADTNPSVPDLTARHLAYVIYTSGSTGKPKGVMVEHRGVVNLAQAQIACFKVRASSRVVQFASFSFDASVSEIFMALGHSASLYLPSDRIRYDRNGIWQYLSKQEITHATLPPALLHEGRSLPRLNQPLTVILAGEAPSVTLFHKLMNQGVAVFNAYGPTETTVCASAWRSLDHFNNKVPPIGRPIANTRIYLLDAHGQPVPLGAVGELYIGGVGVARGYLNRPELTAEHFVCDPFSDEPGARLYKTGDLARYRPDGNLEFLGRNDHQIKLRGFRIEPGEIEARLAEHPQVRDAVVLARGENNDKRLIAYIVAEADDTLASTLRAHVAAALPEYMVPAAFVRLDAWPLTPNGKLDRRALPEPDDDAFAHHAYEAPQGELETMLAAIWGELLGVERISRHDNFFALGGHSLLAVSMISRIRSVLNISIPIRMLFEIPTVAALAQCLSTQRSMQDDSFAVLLPIQPHGTRPPLFCVHPFSGLSWHYRGLASHLDANQPVYGLQARGFHDEALLAPTLDSMAADYIQQIRRIQPSGPYYLLGWSLGGNVVHSMATQLEQQGEKVALLAVLDSTPNFSQQDKTPDIDVKAAYIKLLTRYDDKNGADASNYLWEKSRAVVQNNFLLLKGFSPRIYSGDMLFFRATVAQRASITLIPPDIWHPYVLGNVEIYNIRCKHHDMDRPEPTAEISRILQQKLNSVQKIQLPKSEGELLK
ncbi:non-ribosomal peptide synthase/polyketide synthase [Mycetohabitans rhizoxinica]|uniref:Non-ribosomal peptide synthase/polyketide synthase n=1 Tax=Mycetohabitans rhizoxinica TaxID=412963 RepID=A0ABZ2Q2W6_9BURK